MKKNLYLIIFLVILILFIGCNKSYCAEDDNILEEASKLEERSNGISDFLSNPVGKAAQVMLNPVGGFVDAIQEIINLVQTIADNTNQDNKVLYTYDELKQDGSSDTSDDTSSNESTNDEDSTDEGKGNRDKYTKVGEYKEGEAVFGRIEVQKDNNQNGVDDFNSETLIPLIVGDLYNVAAGHIDFFDINFLTGNTTIKEDGTLKHPEDSIWMRFRNFAVTIIRMSIYIASSILLISLVWNGISIVRHTLDNPQARAESKQALSRLRNALLILIGTILFMSACIFLSQSFFGLLDKKETYELPIRVDVEDTYSFSTTLAGYVRYMSLIADVDEPLQKLFYTALYLTCVDINVLIIVAMIIRTFAIWALSILGPVISIFYAFGKEGPINIRVWGLIYLFCALFQPIITLIYCGILQAIL